MRRRSRASGRLAFAGDDVNAVGRFRAGALGLRGHDCAPLMSAAGPSCGFMGSRGGRPPSRGSHPVPRPKGAKLHKRSAEASRVYARRACPKRSSIKKPWVGPAADTQDSDGMWHDSQMSLRPTSSPSPSRRLVTKFDRGKASLGPTDEQNRLRRPIATQPRRDDDHESTAWRRV